MNSIWFQRYSLGYGKTSRKNWHGMVVLRLPTMNSVVSNLVTLLISEDKLAKVEGGTWICQLFLRTVILHANEG